MIGDHEQPTEYTNALATVWDMVALEISPSAPLALDHAAFLDHAALCEPSPTLAALLAVHSHAPTEQAQL